MKNFNKKEYITKLIDEIDKKKLELRDSNDLSEHSELFHVAYIPEVHVLDKGYVSSNRDWEDITHKPGEIQFSIGNVTVWKEWKVDSYRDTYSGMWCVRNRQVLYHFTWRGENLSKEVEEQIWHAIQTADAYSIEDVEKKLYAIFDILMGLDNVFLTYNEALEYVEKEKENKKKESEIIVLKEEIKKVKRRYNEVTKIIDNFDDILKEQKELEEKLNDKNFELMKLKGEL